MRIRIIIASLLISGAMMGQLNSTIPLQVNPPNIANPLDTLRKLQEIRETQERIRQMQEQTRQLQEQQQANAQRRQEAENRKAVAAAIPNLSMKLLLGEDGFNLLGLSALPAAQLTLLDKWISLYSADIVKRFSVVPQEPRQAIESEIRGEFQGWSGDTTFELTNGQVWKQASYDYDYDYEFNPAVVIYPINSVFKMKVEGVKATVEVRRIK